MASFELVEQGQSESVDRVEELVPVNRNLSGVERLRAEIDGYLERMQELSDTSPEEVFRLLSGWTARGTELKIQLNRTDNQKSRSFRNGEIEPFLEECDRQFKFHSRIQASQEMDMKLVPRGQI